MSKQQALFPVYFSRAKNEQVTEEDYNNAAALNEDNLNQNLTSLYKYNEELEDTIARLQDRLDELEESLYYESEE